jgi:glutamate synthase (NADPH/NADH) small chain
MIVPESIPAFDELRPPLSEAEAVLAAERCLECRGPYATAPCVLACPVGVDVPGFVGAIADGDIGRAADTIFAENILGATCARVCPVEVLCEAACVLEHEGRPPVEIGRLQRFAADVALTEARDLRPRARPNGRRVAVIGGGPAGLAAAGELAARGYAVRVYDEREDLGGLVRYAIAPYRQVREPLPDEVRALERLGVRFQRLLIDQAALRAIEENADAVVLAVGMGADVDVGYPGDELDGVWESLPFIEAIKVGRAPVVGSRVVVVGGGNTAVDVARESVRLGAATTLVYRRTEAEMPAYPHEVEEAREEGVVIRRLTDPVRFLGADSLTGVECRAMRLGEPDASGRPRPEPVPGSEFVLPADTAVKAIGQRSRFDFLSWIDGLELDRGRIVVDPDTGRTTNPKYFAAGDAVSGGATVVEAVRGAKIVARGIDAALSTESVR